MPAAFFWRIATVSAAVLILQASLPVWTRSRVLAFFMGVGAIGCAGLGSVSVEESAVLHNFFAVLFVGFLVVPQAVFAWKAWKLRIRKGGCGGLFATLTASNTETASLFRPGARIKLWLLLSFVLFTALCALSLLLQRFLVSRGSLDSASYAEGWAIVEVLVVVSALLCNSYIGTIIFDVPLTSKEAALAIGAFSTGARVLPTR